MKRIMLKKSFLNKTALCKYCTHYCTELYKLLNSNYKKKKRKLINFCHNNIFFFETYLK